MFLESNNRLLNIKVLNMKWYRYRHCRDIGLVIFVTETFFVNTKNNKTLGIVRRKILVLDLDETLIHSVLDGMVRPTVKPGTPPDFVLRVEIDRHPVRFFVHKRPHVDYFLDIVLNF